MKLIKLTVVAFVLALSFAGCKKKETTTPQLIFKFKFDPTQARLDSAGNVSTMPSNHAGQNPAFNTMSSHYIELAPGALTPLGSGFVVYKAPETTTGGSTAIDFSKSVNVGDGAVFYQMPLKNITPGSYQYLRVSLAYQNFDVQMYLDTTISTFHIAQNFPATVASFIGFNTYITSYTVKTQSITVNANKPQGYWGFESSGSYMGYPYSYINSGQAPAGSTTVVNPLFATSPIPAGSCVVTAAFNGGNLNITGNETKDIIVTVSLSTNKSFEWVEVGTPDGNWEPAKGENIVDMGIRGMIPTIQY